MPYQIRKSSERGYADYHWLKTYYTFSFANYYNPNFMGFRNLRVINEDYIAPKKGFPMHDHEDMEIITVVLSGQLAHKDSMGNESIIHPGEVQVMSAGSGIIHSEFNPSQTEGVHLLQIWIKPSKKGLAPDYDQVTLNRHRNEWVLVASENLDAPLFINQDVNLYFLDLDNERSIQKNVEKGRYGWLQLIEGELLINDEIALQKGDGLAINQANLLNIVAKAPSKLLFFDLN